MIKKRTYAAVFCLMMAVLPAMVVAAPDQSQGENDHLQVGYAIITPASPTDTGLVVFETLGEREGDALAQAGVLPSGMTTSAMLFVSTSGRLSRNVGVAIANPGDPTTVTLTLNDSTGTQVASSSFPLGTGAQTSKFVTELFADEKSVPQDLTGTLYITSTSPVAIVGFRCRGENFSTLPVTDLAAPSPVPVFQGAGGPGAAVLALFAAGGGFESEIVLANSGTAQLTVSVDLFNPDGTALAATLNGTTSSSFTGITIPAGGVVVLAPRDPNGDNDF